MVVGVRIVGSEVEAADVVLGEHSEPCPIAEVVGLPVRVQRESQTGMEHGFYRVVRGMTNPKHGVADFSWQYGGMCGPAPPVAVARSDGVAFHVEDWIALEDFLESFFDDDDYPTGLQRAGAAEFHKFLSAQIPPAFPDVLFPIGHRVGAHGLQSRALNGKEGVVCAHEGRRIGVRFPTPWGVKAIKPENLTLLPQNAERLCAPAALSKEQATRTCDWTRLDAYLWQLPELLQHQYPLTSWEFGIAFESIGKSQGSVMTLCVTSDGQGGFIAVPQATLLCVDWWRGRGGDLPVPVYTSAGSGYDAVSGFLCYGDDMPEEMSDPRAPCHPCRTRLLVRPVLWERRGTVNELDELLERFPPTEYKYAVDWASNEQGWALAAAQPREVAIRQSGRACQATPVEGVVAWLEDCGTVAREPEIDFVLSDEGSLWGDMPLRPEVRKVISKGSRVVLGYECLVSDCDFGGGRGGGFEWSLKRKRHGVRECTSFVSPGFRKASVYTQAI